MTKPTIPNYGDEAAFPRDAVKRADMNGCRDVLLPAQWGLTKREYFAALAMQGWLANKDRPQHFQPKDDMEYCVKIADCLLAALAK